MEDQMDFGGEGLDMYLLDINLETLDSTTGEEQEYWLMALRAARVATQLRNAQNTGTQQRTRVGGI